MNDRDWVAKSMNEELKNHKEDKMSTMINCHGAAVKAPSQTKGEGFEFSEGTVASTAPCLQSTLSVTFQGDKVGRYGLDLIQTLSKYLKFPALSNNTFTGVFNAPEDYPRFASILNGGLRSGKITNFSVSADADYYQGRTR